MVSNRLSAVAYALVAVALMLTVAVSCDGQDGGYPTPQLRSVQHG
jgi:hypothetical protein